MFSKNYLFKFFNFIVLSPMCFTTFASDVEEEHRNKSGFKKPLTFERAINTAQMNDPWLKGSRHKQSALESLSTAANTLPDPKVSIGIANVASDSFDFTQEPMSQLKVGVSQMFARGDSLAIKEKQLRIESQQFPYQRQDRQAKVAVTVGHLWLDAFRVQQSIALIERNRSLFEQLGDVAEASYSSAVGKTRQQDIVRAQLELTRLEDKLNQLTQQKSSYEGQLLPWVNQESSESIALHNVYLGDILPDVALLKSDIAQNTRWLPPQQLFNYFNKHPSVLAIEKKILAAQTGIALANQKYQPAWGLNASYAYRGDDAFGNDRADLMSVGVSFDLPLFTENKQDMAVKSAISTTEAIKTEKILLLRQLMASYNAGKGRLLELNKRKSLFDNRLLPQTRVQAEASLTAYTNDDGDFSEVVRARIAVLNVEIDHLAILVEQKKIQLSLNYLFIASIGINGRDNFNSYQHQPSSLGGVEQ